MVLFFPANTLLRDYLCNPALKHPKIVHFCILAKESYSEQRWMISYSAAPKRFAVLSIFPPPPKLLHCKLKFYCLPQERNRKNKRPLR